MPPTLTLPALRSSAAWTTGGKMLMWYSVALLPSVPFCLARIPQGDEVRGNLAAGGKGVAQPLNDADRQTATEIGRVLAPRGLLLVGLDIIGDKVTEINVTSPTCFQEIHDQTGCDVPALFIDALERACEAKLRS